MKAHDDLTFNVIGATIESPLQNPPACLYKPRVCGNKAELLRQNLCHVRLSLARRGAGLVDSRLTSPQDPSALLREVPLPLSFCGAPSPPLPPRLCVDPIILFLRIYPDQQYRQRLTGQDVYKGKKE